MAASPEVRAEALSAALNGQRRRPNVWVDALDLVAEPEPAREWVIEDFVERQGRVVLVGAEGAGKSLLALTLAVQAAAGHVVLDAFPVDLPRRVLYVDLEMARASTRRRLRPLAITSGLKRGALEVCLRPDGLRLEDPEERQAFFAHLERIEPDLVVIDPLYKLMETESVYERDTKPALQFLDLLRLQLGCAIVLVHHLRKRPQGEATRGKDSSDVFGSSVLNRWPETILSLSPTKLVVWKDRDATFGDFRAFAAKFGGHWPVSLYAPSTELEMRIYELLAEQEGSVGQSDVLRQMKVRKADVLDALRTLEAAGRIRKTMTGWEIAA